VCKTLFAGLEVTLKWLVCSKGEPREHVASQAFDVLLDLSDVGCLVREVDELDVLTIAHADEAAEVFARILCDFVWRDGKSQLLERHVVVERVAVCIRVVELERRKIYDSTISRSVQGVNKLNSKLCGC